MKKQIVIISLCVLILIEIVLKSKCSDPRRVLVIEYQALQVYSFIDNHHIHFIIILLTFHLKG